MEAINNFVPENVSRAKFTPEEDILLIKYVNMFGIKNWRQIAFLMQNRSMRQCRERWKYFLAPDSSNRNQWTQEEDFLLICQFNEIGPQWSKMAPLFKGRSGVSLKNRFHLLERNNIRIQEEIEEANYISSSNEVSTPEVLTSCSSDEDVTTTIHVEIPEFLKHIEFPCSLTELNDRVFNQNIKNLA